MFSTFTEQVGPRETEGQRTYLLVVPSKPEFFQSFLASHSFSSSQSTIRDRLKCKMAARKFAAKLHTYSHLRAEDMMKLCDRAGVRNPILDEALKRAVDRCSSCKGTGRPLQNRSVAIRKVLSTFNTHVQLDFFYVTEMGNAPVLHLVDVSSGFSATALVPSRDIDVAARTIEKIWISIHGAPAKLSGDPEFVNNKFLKLMDRFSISVEPRPARRHQKIGVVERKHSIVRTLTQRIFKDVEFLNEALLGIDSADQDPAELHAHVLSRATYMSNILYGSRTLSSFEMVRGYTPSIAGLPQSTVTDEMNTAHQEQSARRALLSVESARSPRTLKKDQLQRGTAVYFFRRVPKPTWVKAWVRSAQDHLVLVSTRQDHSGKPVRAAYEDLRLQPETPLLKELDECDPLYPNSMEFVDAPDVELLAEPAVHENNPHEHAAVDAEADELSELSDDDEDLLDMFEYRDAEANDVDDDHDSILDFDDVDGFDLPPLPSSFFSELNGTEEEELWRTHPSSRCFLTDQRPMRSDSPLRDVSPFALARSRSLVTKTKTKSTEHPAEDLAESHDPPRPDRDIGSTPIAPPPSLPVRLESSEQSILQSLRTIVGDKPVSEFRLQFAPRWLLDKSIETEKQNYFAENAYEEVYIKTLPRSANIISSHHFFQIKHDGSADKLKLKCRMTPHGNQDDEKDFVRKDSRTAQFPIIRTLICLCILLDLSFATLDIKSAYLQAGKFPRTIFVRPPKGWAKPGVVWRILKPAYGLVESGRLWQLAIERWFNKISIFEANGLPQLFVKRDADGNINLLIAKVVDDLLIAGRKSAISEFHEKIRDRFKVGRFQDDEHVIFNRLHISREGNGDITLGMEEYLSTIKPIELSRQRRKQQHDLCTTQETTDFLALTGSLNFLGHGVLPPACFIASHLQQCMGKLTVSHLCTANKCLHEMRSLTPALLYVKPQSITNPSYLGFSDASQGKTSYGQTGYVSGIHISAKGGGIFYLIDWVSSKQGRVSFSSIGAEILAAATSADRGSMTAESIQGLVRFDDGLPFILTVDSNGLYSTITTLSEGSDYRLRPTVARLRDSFENEEISTMQWIPGKDNLSDALTKRNVAMFAKLNKVARTGRLLPATLNEAKRAKFN